MENWVTYKKMCTLLSWLPHYISNLIATLSLKLKSYFSTLRLRWTIELLIKKCTLLSTPSREGNSWHFHWANMTNSLLTGSRIFCPTKIFFIRYHQLFCGKLEAVEKYSIIFKQTTLWRKTPMEYENAVEDWREKRKAQKRFAAQEFWQNCYLFDLINVWKYFQYLTYVCVILLLKKISPVKSKQKAK